MEPIKTIRLNLKAVLEFDRYMYVQMSKFRGADGVYDLPEEWYDRLKTIPGCVLDG